MPTILNTYSGDNSGGLGAALTGLGNTLFGPGALQADLYRKKARELQLNIDTREGLGNEAANGIADLANNANMRRFIMQSEDPRKALQGQLGLVAGTFGAQDPRTTNAAVGAGESYASTPQGFNTAQSVELKKAQMSTDRAAQTARYAADNTPTNVVVNGRPVVMSRSEAIRTGAQPVVSNADAEGTLKLNNFDSGFQGLNREQLAASGAQPNNVQVMNWDFLDPATGTVARGRTADGKTDMTTGQPLPASARVVSSGNAGTALGGPLGPDNQQMRDLRGKINANQELVGLTNEIEKRVKADPTIVGASGQIQSLGQNALAVARDAANALGKGKTIDESVNNIRNEAVQKYGLSNVVSLFPDMFKPSINELETLHTIMVYKTAEALAGQEGRNLSDRDVKAAKAAAGDPTAWTSSSPQVLSHLATIRNIATGNTARYTQMLNSQNMTNVPPQAIPQQGALPMAGAAPAAAPAGNAADPLGIR